MIAVSDTSPLHYLVAAGGESLLNRVFGEIVIPRAVQRELEESPHRGVQQWIPLEPQHHFSL
jgi:predicted nucleic acid-binding protein